MCLKGLVTAAFGDLVLYALVQTHPDVSLCIANVKACTCTDVHERAGCRSLWIDADVQT